MNLRSYYFKYNTSGQLLYQKHPRKNYFLAHFLYLKTNKMAYEITLLSVNPPESVHLSVFH